MINIVVGGQIDKSAIEKIIKEIGGEKINVEIMNDLEAVMALKEGKFDYYMGACETGSGGALAMAIALIGIDKTMTISRPGYVSSDEEILKAVEDGKIAFGFTSSHIEKVVPLLTKYIINK